ncbi:hypothetical protein ID866_1337 [Astraeus odoratus]|nr:hypothetical protein ID866_1337 [Astraeus odoratus]
MVSPLLLVVLFFVAMLAGFIDALAGGGGLLTVPALLAAGMSPAQALATNKLQACGGSLSASLYFIRRKVVNLADQKLNILMTFIGSTSGALLVQHVQSDILRQILPILVICIGLYFLLMPKLGEEDRARRLHGLPFALIAGGCVGFYDGFFGPGAGSFYALAFVTLAGFNLAKSTAHAKVLNATSNVGGLLLFIIGGKVIWATGCFADDFNTRLIKGDDEPIYLPADAEVPYNRIVFAHGFYASGLHEISHWCIAGKARRELVDFGYWYCPDGRDAATQGQFEDVEVKPQALEWLFCVAAGFPFNVSCDNLEGDFEPDRIVFQRRVHAQVMEIITTRRRSRRNASLGRKIFNRGKKMIAEFESRILALIDDMVEHASDDELFASGYLRGHLTLAVAELEAGDDHSADAVHAEVTRSLEKAILAGELSPRDQSLVLGMWDNLFQQAKR